jgi:hypothetical protein
MSETNIHLDRPLLERFGIALHKRYDDILQEPLPERWTDLINRLNAEEATKGQPNES